MKIQVRKIRLLVSAIYPTLLFLGRDQKEIPVIVDMKKAVKGVKRKMDKNNPNTNKKIMNFDFTVQESLQKQNTMEEDSSTVDNIIGEAFTLNNNSPTTVHSKLMPYQDNISHNINNQFKLYQNYQDFDTNRDRTSQASFKAKSEVYNDGSRKVFIDNPYTKQEKFMINSVKKPNVNYKKQPNSAGVSSTSKRSKPNSGQRSPLKTASKLLKEDSKKIGKKHGRSKDSRRKRNFSGTIESADDPEIIPVYIDTGGSNMQ